MKAVYLRNRQEVYIS